jgi:hypothetical protein
MTATTRPEFNHEGFEKNKHLTEGVPVIYG